MKRFALALGALLLTAGCGQMEFQQEPIVNPADSDVVAVQKNWCPCVGVHTPGGPPFDLQMTAVQKLVAAGRLKWVRLGTEYEGYSVPYHNQARSMGLKIIVVVQLVDLDQHGWHETLDKIVELYHPGPNDIVGIAGEVTNNDPYVNPNGPTTWQSYMQKFADLVYYAKDKYPELQLSNGPTFGSAGGPRELQQIFDLEEMGLLDLPIKYISINLYTDTALQGYAALFQKARYREKMAGKRIIVTETGSGAGWQYHIAHVRDFYPRLSAMLDPELICWYQLWAGDWTSGVKFSKDEGYGMLNGLNDPTRYEEGPLFRALVYGNTEVAQ